jgi:hypothetical protein
MPGSICESLLHASGRTPAGSAADKHDGFEVYTAHMQRAIPGIATLPGAVSLFVEILDHRHFAVGHLKAQPFDIALRSAAALCDHDRVLASGLNRGGHACP